MLALLPMLSRAAGTAWPGRRPPEMWGMGGHRAGGLEEPRGRVSVSVVCGLTSYSMVTPPSAAEEPCA